MKPEKFIADFLKQHNVPNMPSDWAIRSEVNRAKAYGRDKPDAQKRGVAIRISCESSYICTSGYGKSKLDADCMKAIFRIKKPGRFWEAEFVRWLNQPEEAGE